MRKIRIGRAKICSRPSDNRIVLFVTNTSNARCRDGEEVKEGKELLLFYRMPRIANTRRLTEFPIMGRCINLEGEFITPRRQRFSSYRAPWRSGEGVLRPHLGPRPPSPPIAQTGGVVDRILNALVSIPNDGV